MTTIRAFEPEDTFHFNSVNLDPFTETVRRDARVLALSLFAPVVAPGCIMTRVSPRPHPQYNMGFYYQYYTRHPEYFKVAEAPDGRIVGYVMGKAEGEESFWARPRDSRDGLTEYRRMGLATELMRHLEEVSEKVHDCYFVDLCDARAPPLSPTPALLAPDARPAARAAASSEFRTSRRSPCTRRWATPSTGACWVTTLARSTRNAQGGRARARGDARARRSEKPPSRVRGIPRDVHKRAASVPLHAHNAGRAWPR